MVGIVLVSHSHEAAEGTAALARQMGGEGVAIATAGGLEGDDHPIGTDAMRVLAAIEDVWSDDGVLVLMDLGSAVLSAEMAVEFLDDERRPRVLLSDAPFVEGAVAAAVSARLGLPLEDVEREARGGLAGKSAHLGVAEAPDAVAAPETRFEEGPEVRLTLTVDLPHGLHARPAARFVQTASAFEADVRVSNATTGHGPVSARSLNAVATLGVTQGHEIDVLARGPGAAEALEALRALAGRRFDEAPEDLVAPPVPEWAPEGGPATEGVLRGFAASPGVAVAPARRFHVPELAVPDAPPEGSPDDEQHALERALAGAHEAIARQRDDAAVRVGAGRAAIFEAHLLFLQDDALLEPARDAVRSGAS
ncbi:MAG: dihydroxyacetone kinase phosphoryl donor subunit DhaM, partial [Actinomycetota bacterium]